MSKALHDTSPFILFTHRLRRCFCQGEYGIISVFFLQQLQHARECANVKLRFIPGQIPGELERAGFITAGHMRPVPGSIAKHCAFWQISPPSQMDRFQMETPAESSWWMGVGERETALRTSQRENGRSCQGRGPPRPE